MARPRTHHDQKKQELIKVAFELFMKDGYENTSIQDIMNVAQISKGAMYHYFTCKGNGCTD
jgi:Transcriptional regulator